MSPGEVLAGRFEIEELAGEGGMSRVYRAIDRTTAMPVAIKVLAGLGRERGTARFNREIELLRELVHPRVARYVEAGVTPDGARFFAMEWLKGEDLAVRLGKGPLTVPAALALVRSIAEPLEIAHARGVVHRDIKPSNVFLVDGSLEDVKLLDFGVAIRARGDARLTGTGGTVGTPAYMAPEQARGERAITPRVDVYALGCILFECITGHPAFGGDHVIAVLGRILFGDAPRLREVVPDVPPAVDDLVARMLSRDPNGRPADAAAVRDAIDALPDASREVVELLPTLTSGEQRVVCVVVAAPPQDAGGTIADGDGDTVDASATHEALLATAESHGGRLERLANGAVVAIFLGASPTDEVERAASCALRIAAILERAPVALFTGRAVVGGRIPFGEVIARAASAIEDVEGGLGVRIDNVTAGLLPARFVVNVSPDALVLEGEGEDGEAQRRLLGRPTRCVGRERELATLRGTLASAIEDESARAVLVTAAPGTGKSRLVDELLRAVRNDRTAVEIMVGRGDPLGSPSPFSVIGRVIRRAAGIEPADPFETRLSKLRTRVARTVPAADRDRLVELLAEIGGVHIPDASASAALRAARVDPLLMRDVLRGGVSDWLAHELASGPVLLVVEDLHWSDAPSVRVIETLLRTATERPFMVVATARPEVHTTFPNLWTESGVSEMRLGMLPKKGSERLVREALGDAASDDVVAMVVERAAGHPFFLEELVRAVAAGGDPSALPDTVLGMLQARLDALGADTKRILRAASVFGETFWANGVVALVGSIEARAVLGELVEKEIVEERVQGTVAGERELVFRHALVRDAAYAMLTDVDRELGHRLAARWLESVQSEADEGEHAHLLAYHLGEARLFAEAIAYAQKAASRAVRLGRLSEALALLEQARKWSYHSKADLAGSALQAELLAEEARLADMIGDRARQREAVAALVSLLEAAGERDEAHLALRRGELETLMGQREDARRSFDRALEVFRARGDRENELRTLRSMAFGAWQHGWFDESVALNEEVLALTSEAEDPDARSRDLLHLAMSLFRQGEIDRSRAVLAQCEAVPGLERRPRDWPPLLQFRANVLGAIGDTEAQLACYRQALAIEEEHGLVPYRIITLISSATALSNLGRTDEGLAAYRGAIAIARAAGFGSHLNHALRGLAAVLVPLGRAKEAATHLVEAAAVCAKLGDLDGEANAWTAFALAHEARDDGNERFADAKKGWERARTTWQQLDDGPRRLEALEGLGRCARARGIDVEAVAAYQEAAKLAKHIGASEREGAIWNTLGILDWERGRFERALERYVAGLAIYEAANDDPHTVLMTNSLAAATKKLGRTAEARAWLDRSLEIARRSGERLLEGHALALLGELHAEAGERDEAAKAWETSLSLREALGDRRGEGWMLLKLAEIERDAERARGLRERAAVAAAAAADVPLEAAVRQARGAV